MSVQLDPEEEEIKALCEAAGNFKDLRILEVGCGDGRLTWRYASQAARVDAIDPDPDKINRALQAQAQTQADQIHFFNATLEGFYQTYPANESYDLALLAWSL